MAVLLDLQRTVGCYQAVAMTSGDFFVLALHIAHAITTSPTA